MTDSKGHNRSAAMLTAKLEATLGTLAALEVTAVRAEERRIAFRDARARIARHRQTYTHLYPADLDRILKEAEAAW